MYNTRFNNLLLGLTEEKKTIFDFDSSSGGIDTDFLKNCAIVVIATSAIALVVKWLYQDYKRQKNSNNKAIKKLSESYIYYILKEDFEDAPWYERVYQKVLIPFIEFMKKVFHGLWFIIRGVLKIIGWVASKLSDLINKFLEKTSNFDQVTKQYEENVNNILKYSKSIVLRDKLNGIEDTIPRLKTGTGLSESELIFESNINSPNFSTTGVGSQVNPGVGTTIGGALPINSSNTSSVLNTSSGSSTGVSNNNTNSYTPSSSNFSSTNTSSQNSTSEIGKSINQGVGTVIGGVVGRNSSSVGSLLKPKVSESTIRKVIKEMVELINITYPHLSVNKRAHIMKDALKSYAEAVVQNQPQVIPQPGVAQVPEQQPVQASNTAQLNNIYTLITGDPSGIANSNGTMKPEAVKILNSPKAKAIARIAANASGNTNITKGSAINDARRDVRTAYTNRNKTAREVLKDTRGNLSSIIQAQPQVQ